MGKAIDAAALALGGELRRTFREIPDDNAEVRRMQQLINLLDEVPARPARKEAKDA